VLNFDVYLREAGVDLDTTRLVRHQDTRKTSRFTPYELWHKNPTDFELYQRIQAREIFRGIRTIASFVANPMNECLFVGLYSVEGQSTATEDIKDPISGEVATGLYLYDLCKLQLLSEYDGRLFIDWGQGYRAWVQLAKGSQKLVTEVRRAASDPPFPGFLAFRSRLSELPKFPLSWRETLSAVSGVYLLTHPETGKQYVGSAQGVNGFWGRWETYVASNHGGNVKMQDIPEADYYVTILEFASSSAGVDEIFKMENLWKSKLHTRVFGLNAN